MLDAVISIQMKTEVGLHIKRQERRGDIVPPKYSTFKNPSELIRLCYLNVEET